MAYIQGEGRSQDSLFSVVLDDFIPVDHMCRVIDAFVVRLALSELGFERAQAAETGRPGYDFLKFYLYGWARIFRAGRASVSVRLGVAPLLSGGRCGQERGCYETPA
jgi:transposase